MGAQFLAWGLNERCWKRSKLVAAVPRVVLPFEWQGAAGRTCWHHVRRVIEARGGDFAYGWALASFGPTILTDRQVPPLYSRWVNHVVWRDALDRLWEVTPVRDEFDCTRRWMPTTFIADAEARFEIATDETCCPQPAVYVAVRPEGECTADCLCEAERASPELQDLWLDRALDSIRETGLQPTNWRVKRVGQRLRDIWIVANAAGYEAREALAANMACI